MLETLWAISIVASVLAVDYSQVRVLASKALDRTALKYVSNAETLLQEEMQYFSDVGNVIMCRDSDTVIVHISKLNSAARYAGKTFETWPNPSISVLEKSRQSQSRINVADSWVELHRDHMETVRGDMAPITGCLNCERGDGGALTGKYTTTIGRTSSLDLLHGFSVFLIFGLAYSFEFVTTLTISATFSCTVPNGTVGQVFLQPFLVRFIQPQARLIGVARPRFWQRLNQDAFSYGEWRDIDEPIEFISIGAKPIVLCVTEPSKLDCNGLIMSGEFY